MSLLTFTSTLRYARGKRLTSFVVVSRCIGWSFTFAQFYSFYYWDVCKVDVLRHYLLTVFFFFLLPPEIGSENGIMGKVQE